MTVFATDDERAQFLQRFESKVRKVADPGCWFFLGAPDGGGYGRFCFKGKTYMAHRLSYEFHHGEIAEGLVVDHLCTNKQCVNPAHLEAVTSAENTRRAKRMERDDLRKRFDRWRRLPGGGSIQQRGDVWRLVVNCGLDPVTGKRRQKVRSVRGSRNDAEKALALLLTESGRGDHAGHDAPLEALIRRWLDQTTLSPSTRLDYGRAIKSHLPATMLAVPVWKLRAHDLDALYSELARRNVGPQRIRRVHNILRSALSQAVKWQWIARNPAVDASPPAVVRSAIRPPSPSDVRRVIAAAEGQLAVYIRLSVHLGARRGEVCALQWNDIDLDIGELTIRRALVEAGPGAGVVAKSTKTDRDRTVAIDGPTVAMLRAHRIERAQVAMSAGIAMGPWVFAGDALGMQPVRPDSMTRRFIQLRDSFDDLDSPNLRLHDLRHFLATRLLAAGVDPRTVSGRVGHARTSTTLDLYAAFVPARDRDAAEIMGKLLG